MNTADSFNRRWTPMDADVQTDHREEHGDVAHGEHIADAPGLLRHTVPRNDDLHRRLSASICGKLLFDRRLSAFIGG
jgi:hypothetical protein